MQLNLTGKAALVTGSSRGIGRAIAEMLLAEGCRVAINGRTAAEVKKTASELSATAVVGNVSQPHDAQRIIAETISALGKLDVLICNVGSGRSVAPGSETYDEWQRIFALNFWSTTNMVEAAHVHLAATQGSIVCISSICGNEVIAGAPITYSVAKSALNAYVHSMARPLGKQGVRINAVSPGNILFEGSVWSKKLAENSQAVQLMLDQEVSLSRLGSPQEVAELVAYLASPRANFATGSVWTLDGGQAHS